MSDKLARAQHTRVSNPGETSKLYVGGRHAGTDRTRDASAETKRPAARHSRQTPSPRPTAEVESAPVPQPAPYPPSGEQPEKAFAPGAHAARTPSVAPRRSRPLATADPGSTADIPIIGKHLGTDRTLVRASQPEPQDTATSVGFSAALISVCVLLSRITGFARTWVMAFALGSTLLASSYQVANNLPTMLYELVAGGMLVTAFLPVYLSIKKKLGQERSNEYASNLLTIVVLFLAVVAVLCMAFPSVIIYTQSFYSDQAEMAQSVFFFQFFAIQIVFYGASAIVSGLLNANRDYLWSSIAPVANNVIVIATFLLFAAVAPQNQELALYIIAIGNPLGVFVQMAIQLPALKRNGIRMRPRVNFRDPALRETLSIGIPAVFVMLCSFAVVSVQTAASYSFADNGPSVLYYARQWFMLPYSLLAIPITTAMFTELADMQSEGNVEGVKRGIVSGTSQILFFMVPFALYLIVFSVPLVTVYNAGAFTTENVVSIAGYLGVFACALPFYGVNTYLQKIFSSLRKMGIFAGFNFAAGAVQVGLTMFAAANTDRFSLTSIAAAEIVFYLVADICLFAYLRRHLGPFGLRSMAKACVSGLVFGGLGAATGFGVLFALETFVAPLSGSIAQAFGYVVAGGLASLAVTFGLAIRLHVPEAAFAGTLIGKVRNRFARSNA